LAKLHSHHYTGLLGRFRSRSGLQKINKLFSNFSNLKEYLVECWKSFIISKTNIGPRWKNACGRIRSDTKTTRRNL